MCTPSPATGRCPPSRCRSRSLSYRGLGGSYHLLDMWRCYSGLARCASRICTQRGKLVVHVRDINHSPSFCNRPLLYNTLNTKRILTSPCPFPCLHPQPPVQTIPCKKNASSPLQPLPHQRSLRSGPKVPPRPIPALALCVGPLRGPLEETTKRTRLHGDPIFG